MEQLDRSEISKIAGYIKYGVGLQLGGGQRLPSNAIVWLCDHAPTANVILDFDTAGACSEKYDFVVFPKSLGYFDNPIGFTLKKVINSFLKKGAYIIIVENQQGSKDAKHKWLFEEMEGALNLYADILHTEQKINGNPSYIYVMRMKGVEYVDGRHTDTDKV